MSPPGRLGLLALTVLLAPAVSAQAPPDYVALARAQLQTGNRDSAFALLRLVTDSASREPVGRRIEAWILAGVAHFYGGNDSAAAGAFRSAFTLDPTAQARGLAQMDSLLGVLFEAQRPRPNPIGLAVPTPSSSDSVYDCQRRCPTGVSQPSLAHFPQVTAADAPPPESQIYPGSSGLGPSGVHGTIEFHFVINEAGITEPGSIIIALSTARRWEQVLSQGLQQARFLPAKAGGRAVRARVRLRVDIRAEGMATFEYRFYGP